MSMYNGDELHSIIPCRLVAKHLVAKYGGKDAEDLLAAMPPFELAKALRVKAVQRGDRTRSIRKVMSIDVPLCSGGARREGLCRPAS